MLCLGSLERAQLAVSSLTERSSVASCNRTGQLIERNVAGKLEGLIATRFYRRNPYANPRLNRSE